MSDLKQLLENNKQWVAEKLNSDAEFFDKLSSKHEPKYLWLGCSDARVPATNIVGVEAGEMFVQRNVGNVVSPNDSNIRAVIGYAVEALGVKDIIVCGHYGCGAVKASLSDQNFGTVDEWVKNIKTVVAQNQSTLNELDGEAKERKMVELNVQAQLNNLANTPMVKIAWENGQDLTIHGWVYDVADGKIRELFPNISSENDAGVLNF